LPPQIGKRFVERLQSTGGGIGEAGLDARERLFTFAFEQAQSFSDDLLLGIEAAKGQLLLNKWLEFDGNVDAHMEYSERGLTQELYTKAARSGNGRRIAVLQH
jgi:hypothetical protein